MDDFSREPVNSDRPEGNEIFNEDFEKVDEVPEQDEEVTSTSFTGEEAEEDRYQPGTSPSEAAAAASNNLLDFEDNMTEINPVSANEPLISFGSPSGPEPSAPPATSIPSGMGETSNPLSDFDPVSSSFKTEPKVTQAPVEISKPPTDSWLKNVDPRVKQDFEDTAGNMDFDNDDFPASETDIMPESELPPYVSEREVSTIAEEKSLLDTDFSIIFRDLIYWKDYKKTGVVFGTMLFVLLSLAICSVLSVLAYFSLAVLTVTLSFRVYKNILQAVQKTGDAHPFKLYLDMSIDIPEDKAREALTDVLSHINCTIKELRRLFLIEDLVDSLKFALLLWVLTYIGSWFNGMTLIILAVVTIFTLPKVYETYQVQIDNYINLVKKQKDSVWEKVQEKVPFLKKKQKTQ